jgi:hypothetical protein
MKKDPKLGLFVNFNPGAVLVGKLYSEWTPTPSDFAPFTAITPVGTFLPVTNGTMNALVTDFDIETISAK